MGGAGKQQVPPLRSGRNDTASTVTTSSVLSARSGGSRHGRRGRRRYGDSATASGVLHFFLPMIPSLRKVFNEGFTPDRYRAFLRAVDDGCGAHVQFRLSETPCFFPKSLIDRMASDGQDLILQLVDSTEYRKKSDEAVPVEFRVPNEPSHPMFVQVDFGLVRDASDRHEVDFGAIGIGDRDTTGVLFDRAVICAAGFAVDGLEQGAQHVLGRRIGIDVKLNHHVDVVNVPFDLSRDEGDELVSR